MTIALPQNTKHIGLSAFEKSIPVKGFDNVFPETIGENAFANTGFFETKLTIHNSIKVISANAFAGLASMQEYDSLYNNAKQMPVRITLEEGTETIEAGAFAGQFYLSDVQLCSTLTEIGEGAFSGCIHSCPLPCSDPPRYLQTAL